MVKFSPNLSLLFTELPFVERFEAAAGAGFTAVEFWPYEDDDEARHGAAAGGLPISVINVHPGPEGHHGRMAHADAVDWWRREFDYTVAFAQDIGARCINSLMGTKQEGVDPEANFETARENLTWALAQIAGLDIPLVLEPLDPAARPNQLLTTSQQVADIRTDLGNPTNLLLLFDAFHLSGTEDRDVAALYRRRHDQVGHVQLADAPGRAEPGTGELDFESLFDALDELGYDGWIGLEYAPTGTTEASLEWLDGRR